MNEFKFNNVEMKPIYRLGDSDRYFDLDYITSIAGPTFIDQMGFGGFFHTINIYMMNQEKPIELWYTANNINYHSGTDKEPELKKDKDEIAIDYKPVKEIADRLLQAWHAWKKFKLEQQGVKL